MKHRRRTALFTALGALLFLAMAGPVWGVCMDFFSSHGKDAALPLALITVFCFFLAGAFCLGAYAIFLLRWEKHQQSAIAQGKFYLLSHFSNTCLFEYHFRTHLLTFSDNLPQELGLSARIKGVPYCTQLRERIHPEDGGKLHNLIHTPPRPEQEMVNELRLLHEGGSYVWYECRTVATYDKRGRADTLLGRFENIDARKRREANLIARSTRDDLTGLLNRSAVTLRVEEWMHSPMIREGAALFMIDLDNFKSINDTHGHASGDRALSLTAQVLRETFRNTDVLGRAGGDEFLVFMTGVGTPEIATDRADALCRTLAERSGETFTCSIGVALCPQDGISYAALFESADAAMYMAKREGKNSYRLTSSPSNLVVGA